MIDSVEMDTHDDDCSDTDSETPRESQRPEKIFRTAVMRAVSDPAYKVSYPLDTLKRSLDFKDGFSMPDLEPFRAVRKTGGVTPCGEALRELLCDIE